MMLVGELVRAVALRLAEIQAPFQVVAGARQLALVHAGMAKRRIGFDPHVRLGLSFRQLQQLRTDLVRGGVGAAHHVERYHAGQHRKQTRRLPHDVA
jgi:hypothetical protein